MATKRWNSSKSTLLAKQGTSYLGGGDDEHQPVGYWSSTRFRGAIDFSIDWTGVTKIDSAVLSVKTTSQVHVGFGSDPDVYVQRITGGEFSPNGDRSSFDSPPGSGWTSAPDDYGDIASTSTGRSTMDVTTSENTWDTVDITAIVEAWAPATVLKSDGSTPGDALGNYGLLLKPVVNDLLAETTEFYSHEAGASNRPSILLTYTANPAPSAPTTNLAPTGSGNAAVPTFSGNFDDAGDTMKYVDIQVSTDSTFASATHWNLTNGTGFGYDSGTTVWNIPYAGDALSPSTTYYWRARVADSLGTFSSYCATQSFSVISTPTPPVFRVFPPRIELFAIGASRGIGELRAIIDDAKKIGVSAYGNATGELYFTVPYNHPQASEIVPLQRHYRVSRYDAATGAYGTVARGIIEDVVADNDEAVVYGHDYMGLLETSISAASTSYTSTALGTIINDQVTAAIGESNSRLAFTSVGTIDATSITTTLITNYQPRLDFISQVASVSMSDRSVRSIFSINRDSPYQWNFTENDGSEELTNLRLELGGLVNGFYYAPDFKSFATHIAGVGQKREGATVLYSTQSSANPSTYGYIARPAFFQDVVNQSALDKLVSRAAKTAGVPDKRVSLTLRANRLVPWDGWDIGDSARVIISRGPMVNINGLYTIWGMEWIVNPDGREDLFLSLATKLT
ncbi:MAG: hypothetical protein IT345_10605 [Trueperaceae bacterium]|nr:hypothetical protein [Trueperaceae bacterium]